MRSKNLLIKLSIFVVSIGKTVFTYFCIKKMRIASSNINAADYDRTKQELKMTFINRPRWLYVYHKVSPRIWVEFVKSKSKGHYFHEIISKFSYTIKYN